MYSVFSPLLFLILSVLSGFVLGFGHDVHERRYDHYYGIYSDSELMIDVLNNFGLRILMAHNEHNDNNIAFSPYGIGVILMALGEGLRGEALYEIRKAIYLPYDAHTIRVGLRDIHRHLKSYFIPKEGFLAGITLNIENVSINPEYIQLLKFYGYDIDSFNTALYPENHVTTTETGVMGGREETTIPTDYANTPTVPNPETTTVEKEDENSTTENQSTSIENVVSTTEETTTSTTTDSSTDTTLLTGETTTQSTITSTEVDTQETTTSQVASQANTETLEAFSSDTIETEATNPENTEASTISESVASEVVSTIDSVTTEEVTTEALIEDGAVMDAQSSSITTERVETTSEGVTISIPSSPDETTQLFTSMTSMATYSTDENPDTTTSMSSTTDETETTTERLRNIRSSEEFLTLSDVEDSLENEEERNSGKETNYNNKHTEIFAVDDWRIRINNQIILLNPDEDPRSTGNTIDAIVNNEKRNPRSVEEYVISRYYHYHNFRPTMPYKPEEPLYFFVNEKTKEAGLDFMTYDTVLPFLYLSNPSAMALAFPLDSERYYLLLMLPSEGYRMDDLICKLYMHNTFKYILNNLELTHVRVNIPSFSLMGRITLTNTLQKLGIRRIFEPRQADFSAMTSTEGVYVTNIEQAISVTIKNNLNIKKDTRHGHHYYSEPVRFDVNRPFLYFVIDSELQIILMTGKVVNPLNVRIK